MLITTSQTRQRLPSTNLNLKYKDESLKTISNDTSKKLMQSINSPEMVVYLKQKYCNTSKILPRATTYLRI